MDQNQPGAESSSTPIQTSQSASSTPSAPQKNNRSLIWCLGILATVGVVTAAVFAVMYFTAPTNPTSTSTTSTGDTTISEDAGGSSLPTVTEVAKYLEDKYDFKAEELNLCYGTTIGCTMDDFDETKKIQFIIDRIPDELLTYNEYINNPASFTKTIKYSDLNDLYKEYFGSTQDIEKKDYTFDGAFIGMKYLPDSDSFEIQFKDGIGGTTSYKKYNKVVEVDRTKDGFSATVISVTFSSVIRTNEKPAVYSSDDGETYDCLIPAEEIEAIRESLSAYKLNFTTEEGEYKLTSIEKLN